MCGAGDFFRHSKLLTYYISAETTHNRPDNKGENPNQQEASSRIKIHPECCWEKLRTASDPKKNGPGIQFLAGNVSWSPF